MLLDTSIVLWILKSDSERISSRATRALSDPACSIAVSVISIWEIVVKHQAGKLVLDAGLATTLDIILQQPTWTILPLRSDAVKALADLPLLHRDPFDRMLIAQAQAEGLTIVTPDSQIRRYDIPTLWQ